LNPNHAETVADIALHFVAILAPCSVGSDDERLFVEIARQATEGGLRFGIGHSER
jgi:hypothetical protein